MEPEVVQKVAAYITHGKQLLVFSHVGDPRAGIQIPAGTVSEGEDLDKAVLREAFEETGLDDLRIESFLGTTVHDMRPIDGSPRQIHRHYFHLHKTGPVQAARWRHWEQDPSEGAQDPILFELFWVELPEEIPELAGGLGEMLEKIIRDD